MTAFDVWQTLVILSGFHLQLKWVTILIQDN